MRFMTAASPLFAATMSEAPSTMVNVDEVFRVLSFTELTNAFVAPVTETVLPPPKVTFSDAVA